MKLQSALLLALIFSGCAPDVIDAPTAPSPPKETPQPPPPPPTFLTSSVTVLVTGSSGGCIFGATVEIVHGQGVGQKLTQTDARCSVWDNYIGGVTFTGLTPRVELTIRANAPGYVAQDFTLSPQKASVGPVMMNLVPGN